MSILDGLLERVGLMPAGQVEARIAEVEQRARRAYEAGFSDGNDDPASGDLASFGYERVTAKGLRDFTKLSNDDLIRIAWVHYQSNPMAKRYLEILDEHILGRGVKPKVDDDDLREVVNDFWDQNDLDDLLEKFVDAYYLFGEQCYPVFVRQSDGRVTIAYIDPEQIEHIVTHPHNQLKRYAVVLKRNLDDKQRVYRIIRRDEGFVRRGRVVQPEHPKKLVTHDQVEIEPWEQAFLEANGLSEYTGSCFYFSANNMPNQPRGFSDLLQTSDWLDADDETLFALADREHMAGYVSWDVELLNTPPNEVQTRAAEIRKRVPKKGQVNVHNTEEVWTMKVPDLKQPGSIATSEALSDRVWGMLGMPKPWRGIGEGSNYASAKVMGEPTRKMLERKQDKIQSIVIEILTFVQHQAEIAGMVVGDEEEITLPMPEIARADIMEMSEVLDKLADALSKYVNELKLIKRERAAEIVSKLLAEIGVEYDAGVELEEIDEEAESGEVKPDEIAIGQLMGVNGDGN